MNRHRLAAILLGIAALFLLLWLARAEIAARIARAYFREHGIASAVEIGDLGLAGVSGRFALGPQGAPEVSAERVELRFDPLSWIPRVVEVRLVNPVVRARLDAQGRITLPALQPWIDSLQNNQGRSRFVSDDLAVSLRGLRAVLATPAGTLDVEGDAKLVKNLPVSARLRARPATIAWQGTGVTLRDAGLDFDAAGGRLAVHFSGAIRTAAAQAQDVDAHVEASGLRWQQQGNRISVAATRLQARLAAASLVGAPLTAKRKITAPKFDLTARNVTVASVGGSLEGSADLRATGSAGIDPAGVALPHDRALANALARNLSRMDISFAAHVTRRGGASDAALTGPLLLRGAGGGVLRIAAASLSGSSDSLNAALDANLSGAGLPAVKLALRNFIWTGGGFTGDAALNARFRYAMLHGAEVTANGTVSWQSGRFAFLPSFCVQAALAAFHPGASDLAKNVRATVCATPGQPLLTGGGGDWKVTGQARAVAATLPLADAQLDKGAGSLSFEGRGGGLRGNIAVTDARVTDRAAGPRFNPLQGSGRVALADDVWRGRFAVTGHPGNPLGEVTFTHAMASGAGTAHIAAPHLVFAPDKLQPDDLSPLLVALRRAEGTAAFSGDIAWTRAGLQSSGRLSIASLDFLTPLGKAHAMKTDIALVSLLPPVTAVDQHLTISRIDWTLPFSAVDLRFALKPGEIGIDALGGDWALGHAAMKPFTVNLADPGHISGTVDLAGVALSSLVSASNLGSKVKLEGKISGHLPFTVGPEGPHIVNGQVVADGPGRLSIDRSLWAQGAASGTNAVQDFAYQALENLSFDRMSADLNSIAGGRLQVVFRIHGRSDPPKPQTAEIAVADLINGTALQKTIPLPSGTPIDLTLDTSLNFDELLKSYAEAWSKSLDPAGATGHQPRGATP